MIDILLFPDVGSTIPYGRVERRRREWEGGGDESKTGEW